MMKLRYLLPLLFCVLSISTRQALADTACHFTTQQASIPAFWTARTLIGPIGGIDTPLIIMNPQSMEGDFPLFQGAAPITCGGSGSNAVTLTGPTDANLWDQLYHSGVRWPYRAAQNLDSRHCLHLFREVYRELPQRQQH
ncbi:Uncharacterised protein [Citrobacter koseri]|uniref:Uncharacterized protein n=1 Tax=Citrobacter koseri TaxID=545 RepID=A0A447URM2_CITKO|nr:Uncharacterised protein [Citrobacter koseri]